MIMAVTALSRWKAKREDFVRVGKKMKPIMERLGAEYFRVGIIHSGAHAGQMLAVSRFSDFTSYGKAMDAATKDKKYQETYAEALKIGEHKGRSIVVSMLE